mgnify:CR=1 FL=1
MVAIIISACASIVSGMVLFLLQAFFKRKQKQDDEREQKRHKKDVLIIKSLNAVADLAQANSIALRDGKTNGELKRALKEYDAVSKEITDFIIENSVEGN